jgi:hypothetical protein
LGNGIIGGINWLRQVPDHGGRERRMVRDAIYIEAKRSQVAFVLNVGDMAAHDGRRPTHWATFLKENKIEQPLVEEIPFLPVIGNHERANDTTYGLANFQTIFDYPRCYTVEFTHAVLLVLDSNLISDQYQDIDDDLQDELFAKWFVSGDDDQTPSWLERQLSASEKSFKIVAMHTPPLSYGKHHHNWLDPSYGRNLLEKRQQLLRLFAEHDVQIVFSGDDHLYQHTVLQLAEGKKIHFIVGGGGSLRDPADAEALARFQHDFESKGLQVSLIRQKRMLHYYLVEVNSGELIVKVLEVSGEKEEPTRLVDEIRIANRYEKPRIKSSAQLF